MASKTTKIYLLVAILATLKLCSAIRTEITHKQDGKGANYATISCIPDERSRSDRMMNPIMMQVGKHGEKPIATIQQHSYISLMDGLKSNYKVDGYFGDSNSNFLRVVITGPSVNDTGEYVCTIVFVDVLGELEKDTARGNLTMGYLDIGSTVHYLMNKVSSLEAVVSDQKDTIREMKDQITEISTKDQDIKKDMKNLMGKMSTVDDNNLNLKHQLRFQNQTIENQQDQIISLKIQLEGQNSSLQNQFYVALAKIENVTSHCSTVTAQILDKVTALKGRDAEHENHISNQSLIINSLVEKDKIISAFSAGYNSNDKFNLKQVILFRHVYVNIGDDFDKTTGVYTAPTEGLYVFHLVVKTYNTNEYLHVNIVANNKVVARVKAYNTNNDDQSSASTVVRLEKGHEVKPVVAFTNTEIATGTPYSVFTGYLLKPF